MADADSTYWAQSSASRVNMTFEVSRLGLGLGMLFLPLGGSVAAVPGKTRGPTLAAISWTFGGDQGQIVIKYGMERSEKLTSWLRSGLTGDRSGPGVDVESAEDEGGESGFGEHDDEI